MTKRYDKFEFFHTLPKGMTKRYDRRYDKRYDKVVGKGYDKKIDINCHGAIYIYIRHRALRPEGVSNEGLFLALTSSY